MDGLSSMNGLSSAEAWCRLYITKIFEIIDVPVVSCLSFLKITTAKAFVRR